MKKITVAPKLITLLKVGVCTSLMALSLNASAGNGYNYKWVPGHWDHCKFVCGHYVRVACCKPVCKKCYTCKTCYKCKTCWHHWYRR